MQTNINMDLWKAPKMKPNVEQLDPDDVGSPEDNYWEGRYKYWFSEEARLEKLKRKLFSC